MRRGRTFGIFGRSLSRGGRSRVGWYVERFGDAMTDGTGPTRDLSSSRMIARIERRSVGRTSISKGALLFFSAQRGVFACGVVDVTNAGAQIRLNGLSVLPPNFELSFDNFHTVRKCRLIWRRGDSIGIAFEN
jgi:hypothetical protein